MARIMTCCFLGHREICETEDLKKRIYEIVEILITEKAVYTFLFGSKSRFNSMCYEIVTQLKVKYPHIQRVYVRAELCPLTIAKTLTIIKGCRIIKQIRKRSDFYADD